MLAVMPRYEAYKDSGVEWLGEIPEHWQVRRIKTLSMIKRGASPRPIDDPRYFSEKGEYSWVRIADVSANEHYLNCTKEKLSRLGASLSVKIQPGQIFLSIAGTVGKPIISKIRCCIHDGFVYFPELKDNPEFIYRVFETGQPYLGLGKHGTQLNLNSETVGNIRIAYPPVSEQGEIISFLDRKTTQIDQAIQVKEKQITLLKERKHILIQNAVTRGLDPAVPMKDSGVDWIGEIPAHWLTSRSKWLFLQRREKAKKSDEQLTASQKYGVIPQQKFMALEGRKVTQVDLNPEILKHVSANDFVISMRSFQGGIEHCLYEGCVSSAYVPLIPQENIHAPYFKYLFKSQRYIEALQSTSNLVRDGQALRYENFCMVDLLIVPVEEQLKIAVYIEQKSTKINKAITLHQQQIERLKEYKATLINSAVTGKIKVA